MLEKPIQNNNKVELTRNSKIKVSSSTNKDITIDEKDELESYVKSKSPEEISNSLNPESPVVINLNHNIFPDIKTQAFDNKNISLGLCYYLCNENYFKDNIKEGSNYKIKSKNYINKNLFNFNKKIIDDFNIDKINNILKDIEEFKDSQNAKISNKFNNDINYINNNDINLNLLLKKQFESFNFDNNLIYNINNYKFDCKF